MGGSGRAQESGGQGGVEKPRYLGAGPQPSLGEGTAGSPRGPGPADPSSLQDLSGPLQTQVDLGCNVYVSAEV